MKTKICTSLDQSKKLLELGIDINTADMSYSSIHNIGQEVSYCNVPLCICPMADNIPAWSLVSLLKLMPFHIITNNNRFGFYQVKGFNKRGETYRFGYKTNNDFFFLKLLGIMM